MHYVVLCRGLFLGPARAYGTATRSPSSICAVGECIMPKKLFHHNQRPSFQPTGYPLLANRYFCLQLAAVDIANITHMFRQTGNKFRGSQSQLIVVHVSAPRFRLCPLVFPGLPPRCSPTRPRRTKQRGCHEVSVHPHETRESLQLRPNDILWVYFFPIRTLYGRSVFAVWRLTRLIKCLPRLLARLTGPLCP